MHHRVSNVPLIAVNRQGIAITIIVGTIIPIFTVTTNILSITNIVSITNIAIKPMATRHGSGQTEWLWLGSGKSLEEANIGFSSRDISISAADPFSVAMALLGIKSLTETLSTPEQGSLSPASLSSAEGDSSRDASEPSQALLVITDPGPVIGSDSTTGWRAAAHPRAVRWKPNLDSITTEIGIPALPAQLVVPVQLAPIALIAPITLFLPDSIRAAVLLLAGLLDLRTAVNTTHLVISLTRFAVASVLGGSGPSLTRSTLPAPLSSASTACTGQLLFPPSSLLPAMATLPPSWAGESCRERRTHPFWMCVCCSRNGPSIGTLIMTPQPDGGEFNRIVRGAGDTLVHQSMIFTTSENLQVASNDEQVTVPAGNLVF
ncbi:hypothetical protein QBC39DRAFT_334310 [Podospora conica]|nr:hypothetical protein QBC39DRAFT_334310 [Schizothecium conicum]